MKETDFRIGNYIFRDGALVTVFTGLLAAMEVNILRPGLYSPIPLTEEWLLKFGFIKCNKLEINSTEGGWLRKGDEIDVVLNSKYCAIVRTNDYYFCVSIPIQYVHQLQNLYFALTGKELMIVKEVKPPINVFSPLKETNNGV